ncbi:MAG: helix-turn-helix transcriptional regulator, partial [Planctomycetota bacterium]
MTMTQRSDVIGSVKAQAWGSLLFDKNRWESLRLALGVTPRELDVVKGVFDDRSRADIGKVLGISEHTV